MNRLWLIGIFVAALGADLTLAKAPGGQTAASQSDSMLGSVRLPRQVTANGQALPAGTYQVRVTANDATPSAAGQTQNLERWVEFVQGGQVKGREVASIVPESDIAQVADGTRPRVGTSRVELLKGGDYFRVWINRGGNHYLIHLPAAPAA